jgi:hypothetical protein
VSGACVGSATDSGPADAGTTVDAGQNNDAGGQPDSGVADSGPAGADGGSSDAGAQDAGVPDAGPQSLYCPTDGLPAVERPPCDCSSGNVVCHTMLDCFSCINPPTGTAWGCDPFTSRCTPIVPSEDTLPDGGCGLQSWLGVAQAGASYVPQESGCLTTLDCRRAVATPEDDPDGGSVCFSYGGASSSACSAPCATQADCNADEFCDVADGLCVAAECVWPAAPIQPTTDGGTSPDAGPPPDAGSPLNCSELIACLGLCQGSIDYPTCVNNCNAMATTGAQTLVSELQTCADQACSGCIGSVCDTCEYYTAPFGPCLSLWNQCQAVGAPCTTRIDCALFLLCDPGRSVCVQCEEDLNCNPYGLGHCDTTSGSCVACSDGSSCSLDAGPPDAGQPDAGPPDAGPPDAGPIDAGNTCPLPQIICDGACIDPMSDPANCGTCGNGCDSSTVSSTTGVGCSNGVCVACNPTTAYNVIATGQAEPVDIAVDSQGVYWPAELAPAIMKAPLGGGTPSTLVSATNFPATGFTPTRIAVGGSVGGLGRAVYFSDTLPVGVYSFSGFGRGTVWSGSSYDAWPGKLVANSNDLYWVSSTTGEVGWVVLATGAYGSIFGEGASGVGWDLAGMDASYVYWYSAGTAPSNRDASIWRAPLEGLALSPFLTNIAGITSATADASNVYYTEGIGTVVKVATSGSATPVTLAWGLVEPRRIVVDGTNAYWSAGVVDSTASMTCNTTIQTVSLNGGPVTDLVTGQYGAYAVAVDNTSVYFTDVGLGTVMSTPK